MIKNLEHIASVLSWSFHFLSQFSQFLYKMQELENCDLEK